MQKGHGAEQKPRIFPVHVMPHGAQCDRVRVQHPHLVERHQFIPAAAGEAARHG